MPIELYDRLRAGTVVIGAFYHCHECGKWHLNLATGFAVAVGGIVSTSSHVLAYDKLPARGFEVVGISLDKDKKNLEKVMKNKGMTWPQHFDGKSYEGELVKRFAITAIPAMWLLGKNVKVTDFDADGGELGGKIEKLLNE